MRFIGREYRAGFYKVHLTSTWQKFSKLEANYSRQDSFTRKQEKQQFPWFFKKNYLCFLFWIMTTS